MGVLVLKELESNDRVRRLCYTHSHKVQSCDVQGNMVTHLKTVFREC